MHVGRRLFPYPVLNSSRVLSSYKQDNVFELRYKEEIRNKDTFVMGDVHCYLKSKFLNRLIEQDKAEIILHVECPQVMYRKNYVISTETRDISIFSGEIVGDYTASAFIVAKTKITINRYNQDFVEEYSDLPSPIEIEKGCILAVDEGYKGRIDFDMSETFTNSSIFTVAVDHYIDEGKVNYSPTRDTICIYLDEKAYLEYQTVGGTPLIRQMSLSLLAVPALTYCLQDLILSNQGNRDIDDILQDTSDRWFVSFCRAFNKKFGHEFTSTDMRDLNDTIQDLFNCPIGKSLLGLQDFAREK